MAGNLELHQHVWLSSSCERLPAISMAGVPRRSELGNQIAAFIKAMRKLRDAFGSAA